MTFGSIDSVATTSRLLGLKKKDETTSLETHLTQQTYVSKIILHHFATHRNVWVPGSISIPQIPNAFADKRPAIL
jgi:hypothetical protein